MPKETIGIEPGVLKEIKTLFAETGVEEIEMEEEERYYLRVSRKKSGQAVHTVAAAPAAVQQAPAAVVQETVPSADKYADENKYFKVKSPVIGTFYTSATPGGEAFVRVGDGVSPDTTVCIVEAMKVMNEIKADAKGKIAYVAKSNGDSALAGDTLLVIEKC